MMILSPWIEIPKTETFPGSSRREGLMDDFVLVLKVPSGWECAISYGRLIGLDWGNLPRLQGRQTETASEMMHLLDEVFSKDPACKLCSTMEEWQKLMMLQ
jgi:hypothetical protein